MDRLHFLAGEKNSSDYSFILNIFENFPAHQVDSNFAKINLTTLVTNHSWLLHFCNLLLKIIVF